MSAKHTPGRALLDEDEPIVRGEDGERIATCYRLFDGDCTITPEATGMENARRLAACWNACEGLDTGLLENIAMLGDTLAIRFKLRDRLEKELTAQRDALLSALTMARWCIQVDFDALVESSRRPGGTMDDCEAALVADYAHKLGVIDAAIDRAKATGEPT